MQREKVRHMHEYLQRVYTVNQPAGSDLRLDVKVQQSTNKRRTMSRAKHPVKPIIDKLEIT